MNSETLVRNIHSTMIIALVFSLAFYNLNDFALICSLMSLFMHTFIAYRVIDTKAGQLPIHISFVFMSTASFIWTIVDYIIGDGVNKRNTSLLLSVIFGGVNMVFFLIPLFNWYCFNRCGRQSAKYSVNSRSSNGYR